MYEIFAVTAILAFVFYGWYSRVKRSRGEIRNNTPPEIPDGGENIAAPSRLNQLTASPSLSEKKLEIPEPAIEIEIEHVQAADETALNTAPLENPATETPSQQAIQTEPKIETEPMPLELQIPLQIPQDRVPVAVLEPVLESPMPEVKAEQISMAIADQKLRIIDILSTAGNPMTVREIAQVYYGQGAYNKRKDSRIRRILAEMTREGLLVETNIENSRAFEIKKQQ
ncbi:MAG: hypothetical protein QXJ68_08055 [Methanocellales archaeon]